MLLKWAQSPKLNVFFVILQLWQPTNIVARFGVCLPGKKKKMRDLTFHFSIASFSPPRAFLSPKQSKQRNQKLSPRARLVSLTLAQITMAHQASGELSLKARTAPSLVTALWQVVVSPLSLSLGERRVFLPDLPPQASARCSSRLALEAWTVKSKLITFQQLSALKPDLYLTPGLDL